MPSPSSSVATTSGTHRPFTHVSVVMQLLDVWHGEYCTALSLRFVVVDVPDASAVGAGAVGAGDMGIALCCTVGSAVGCAPLWFIDGAGVGEVSVVDTAKLRKDTI